VRKELRTWLRRLHDEMHVTTVFVTHDQEEAMDVADGIVVMANARIEQIGPPEELYERPVNDFVMSFLGPVTRLNGRLVRPHDLEVLGAPAPGAVQASVTRVVSLGFEIRVELDVDGSDVWVQVSRETAKRLDVQQGGTVYVRAHEHAIRPVVPGIEAATA
jgi:sulfate transport system ATP-binding protein